MTGYVAGDVNIVSLTLHSIDGCRQWDIKQQVRTINIFENIMSPTIYATVEFRDEINLIDDFPIIKQEYIELEIQTPGVDKISKYHLHVAEVSNRTVSDNGRGQSYILYCCSKEVFNNSTQLVVKKYKQEAGTSIKEIYDSYLLDKQNPKAIYIEPTRGIVEETITQLTPMQAIDKLRLRSTSARGYPSDSFVFFENADGFQLTTLEDLFVRGRQSVCDKVFFFDRKPNFDITGVDIRNIIAFNQVYSGSSPQQLYEGIFGSTIIKFDPVTGGVPIIPFELGKLDKLFQTAEANGAGIFTNTFYKNNVRSTAKALMLPVAGDRNDYQLAQKMLKLRAFFNIVFNEMTHIHVYGDTSITAGDLIQCNFGEITGLTSDPKTNRLTSGNFLINSMRHMISLGDRNVHSMSFSLIKGNYLDNA